MKKLILSLMIFSLFILCTVSPALAEIIDEAGILSEQEAAQVNNEISDLENEYSAKIAIIIKKDLDEDIKDYTTKLRKENYNDKDLKNGSLVFVQDVANRKWYISTSKTMKEHTYDDDGIDYMKEAFLDNLKNDDYLGAYEDLLGSIKELLDGYNEQNVNGINSSGEESSIIDTLIPFDCDVLDVAIVLAICFIVAYLRRRYLIKQMSNVDKAVDADAYLNHDTFKLTMEEDVYLYTSITRTSRSDSDNSSDSDDGGGGGGGSY